MNETLSEVVLSVDESVEERERKEGCVDRNEWNVDVTHGGFPSSTYN